MYFDFALVMVMILPQVHLRNLVATSTSSKLLSLTNFRYSVRILQFRQRQALAIQRRQSEGGVYKGQGRYQRELMTRAY